MFEVTLTVNVQDFWVVATGPERSPVAVSELPVAFSAPLTQVVV